MPGSGHKPPTWYVTYSFLTIPVRRYYTLHFTDWNTGSSEGKRSVQEHTASSSRSRTGPGVRPAPTLCPAILLPLTMVVPEADSCLSNVSASDMISQSAFFWLLSSVTCSGIAVRKTVHSVQTRHEGKWPFSIARKITLGNTPQDSRKSTLLNFFTKK